jgi:type III restriction enzyme
MIQLKEYQRRSLEALESYFRRVVHLGPPEDTAGRAFFAETGRQYIPVTELPGLPYVCLRVPTGAGRGKQRPYHEKSQADSRDGVRATRRVAPTF